MKMTCPYCDYEKPERKLSTAILKVLSEKDIVQEDYLLWLDRLFFTVPVLTEDYHSVKIHVGIKHKTDFNDVSPEINDHEKSILNGRIA